MKNVLFLFITFSLPLFSISIVDLPSELLAQIACFHKDLKTNCSMFKCLSLTNTFCKESLFKDQFFVALQKKLVKNSKKRFFKKNMQAAILMIAIRENMVQWVKYVLSKNNPPEIINFKTPTSCIGIPYGFTPLMLAARSGFVQIVEQLLKSDCIDINKKDHFQRTPLMFAAVCNHLKVVKLLLKHPEVKETLNDVSGVGFNRKIHNRTIHHGNALMIASQAGLVSIVKELLKHPMIDVNARDRSGWSALDKAADWGKLDVVTTLLKHKNIDLENVTLSISRAKMWKHNKVAFAIAYETAPEIDKKRCPVCRYEYPESETISMSGLLRPLARSRIMCQICAYKDNR